MGCGCQESIDVRKIENGELQYSLIGHGDYVNDMILLDDLVTLISASTDSLLKVWNWQTQQCLKTLLGHINEVYSIVLFNKEVLVSAGLEGQVKFWNLSEGKCIKTIKGLDEGYTGVSINKDGVLVLTAYEGTIRYFY